jgi:uncharacterized small protein (DUF1192 family)
MNSIQHLPAVVPVDQPMKLRLASLDPDALADEILRLRALVGPDELAFHELKLELWAARDLVVGKDAELGNVRGHCTHLDREIHIRDVEINKLRTEVAAKPATPKSSEALLRKARAIRDLRH